MTESARRECAWCGDYEDQHNEKGCRICGGRPWEKRAYYCDKFYETHEDAEVGFRRRSIAIYGHHDA